jgi:hypothetical protein
MAIIISKPAGVSFKKQRAYGEIIFEAPICINYAYSDGQKLYIKKRKSLVRRIWNELETIKRYPALIYINDNNKDMLELKRSNWCPVIINKDIVAISSGAILRGFDSKKYSDLKILSIKGLRKMSKKIPNILFSNEGKWIIESILSFSAAMAVINAKGEINIFNKYQGETAKDKLWIFDSFSSNLYNQRQCGFMYD